jgi:hypothetical protein
VLFSVAFPNHGVYCCTILWVYWRNIGDASGKAIDKDHDSIGWCYQRDRSTTAYHALLTPIHIGWSVLLQFEPAYRPRVLLTLYSSSILSSGPGLEQNYPKLPAIPELVDLNKKTGM